jgi:hypothetical protein
MNNTLLKMNGHKYGREQVFGDIRIKTCIARGCRCSLIYENDKLIKCSGVTHKCDDHEKVSVEEDRNNGIQSGSYEPSIGMHQNK